MTLIKRFLLASALLLSLASHSSAQDISTTGDLITNQGSAWTGCYTPTQQGFWGGTSGGPCPGIWTNNEPYNENQIIFSYSQVTLSQTHSLAAALPNSGTGLQVNGYNWHWHVKNSNINGAQPGSYDSIAYVTVDLLSATGSVLESDVYNYGYRIADWINPSGTRTYDNPYSLTNVDSIRLSVTGKDDGYWAGYYGPEFKHFTLSVNYSVDPCASNPLHSPTCSGYLDALAALMPQSPQSTESSSTEPVAVVESSTPAVESVNSSSTPVAVTSQSPTPTVTSTTSSSSRNVGSGLSIGSILSIVRNEQSRISSVESSAVQQANEQAAQATADAQQQAEAVASSAEQQAIEQSVQASSNTQQQSESITSSSPVQQAVEQAVRPPSNAQQQTESVASSDSVSNQSQLEIQSTQSQQTNIEVDNNSNQITNEIYSLSNKTVIEPTSENISVTVNSPTGNLFESTPVIVQEQNNQTTESTVNSNVADNDIAGEVSIAGLQVIPNGFDLYQIGLIDASFYKPKDIYKNQKNVDNARAFKSLSSDRLHQQMVNQQYER
jgi:hypothetical protein